MPGIYFDTAGWTLSGGDAQQMSWTATDAVLSVTRLTSEEPWRPDTLTGFRAHWRERHRAAGEDIVLVEPLEVSNRMALVVASKARDGLAANYRAVIEIRVSPVEGYTVAAQFNEGRSTGMRDAMVSSAVIATCGLELDDSPGVEGGRTVKGFFQDAYDAQFDLGALNSYTDDSRVDVVLPAHPLSRLREWLSGLQASLEIDARSTAVAMILEETPPAPRGPRRLLKSVTVRYLYDAANAMEPLAALLKEEIAEAGTDPTPELALLNLYLGCVACKRERFLDAFAPLRRASELYEATGQAHASGMAETQTRLGQALAHLNRRTDAVAAFRRAIPLFRAFPAPHLEALATSRLAVLLAEMGNEADLPRPPRAKRAQWS